MFDLGTSFVAAVERSPAATAIVEGERRLDYDTWLKFIRCVAGGLTTLGIGRGDHLVAVLTNRYEMATLHWACQLAGVIITPLNWRASAGEVNFVLGDCDAKGVVFETRSANAVAGAARAAA